MRTEWFKCQKCDGENDRCIYCGGFGELCRETWDADERQKHMSRIGSVQGQINVARRDPWTNRFRSKSSANADKD